MERNSILQRVQACESHKKSELKPHFFEMENLRERRKHFFSFIKHLITRQKPSDSRGKVSRIIPPYRVINRIYICMSAITHFPSSFNSTLHKSIFSRKYTGAEKRNPLETENVSQTIKFIPSHPCIILST